MADEAMSAWMPEDFEDEPAETAEQRARRLGWRTWTFAHAPGYRRDDDRIISDDGGFSHYYGLRFRAWYPTLAAALDAIHGPGHANG